MAFLFGTPYTHRAKSDMLASGEIDRGGKIILPRTRKYAWSTGYSGTRIACICQRRAMNVAVTKERLTRFELVSMVDNYADRRVTC